ncbi:MAG TPA: hypothetical protein PLM75_09960 [bacterium]|nr:hypothetical protein [bacterium]
MAITEKIEKIKEYIKKLPGMNIQDPKLKRIAIILYCFILVLWIFAVTILGINYFYPEKIKEYNPNTIISFDEVSKFQNLSYSLNLSTETILENKNTGLLMNSTSSQNDYRLNENVKAEPNSGINTVEIQTQTEPPLSMDKLERIIITDKKFIRPEIIIEDTSITDVNKFLNIQREPKKENIEKAEVEKTAEEKKNNFTPKRKTQSRRKIKKSSELSAQNENKTSPEIDLIKRARIRDLDYNENLELKNANIRDRLRPAKNEREPEPRREMRIFNEIDSLNNKK